MRDACILKAEGFHLRNRSPRELTPGGAGLTARLNPFSIPLKRGSPSFLRRTLRPFGCCLKGAGSRRFLWNGNAGSFPQWGPLIPTFIFCGPNGPGRQLRKAGGNI